MRPSGMAHEHVEQRKRRAGDEGKLTVVQRKVAPHRRHQDRRQTVGRCEAKHVQDQ